MSTNYTPETFTPEEKFLIDKKKTILTQILEQKLLLLNKIKNTFLFKLVLNMNYMIGIFENVKISEDPATELEPYLYLQEGKGINRTLKIDLNTESIKDWETFKFETQIEETNLDSYRPLSIYLLIKISGNNLDYILFGIYNHEKIIPTKEILEYITANTDLLK